MNNKRHVILNIVLFSVMYTVCMGILFLRMIDNIQYDKLAFYAFLFPVVYVVGYLVTDLYRKL